METYSYTTEHQDKIFFFSLDFGLMTWHQRSFCFKLFWSLILNKQETEVDSLMTNPLWFHFKMAHKVALTPQVNLSLLFMCEHKEILLICYKPLIFTQIKQAEKTTCLTFIRKCFSFAFMLKEHFKFKSRMSEIEWIWRIWCYSYFVGL